MKTFILQLEPHDDITSAKDKMGWGKSSHILVVWPEKEKILNRQLDLILLKRSAVALGSQIALVSRDPRVRYYAPRLGIPVYSSLSKARSSIWRLPRRFRRIQSSNKEPYNRERTVSEAGVPGYHRAPPTRPVKEIHRLHPLVRIGLFLAGVVSILLLAAVLLPGAEIYLQPQVNDQGLTIPVRASPDIASIQLTGQVPLRKINVIVEGRDSLPAISRQSFPDHSASGSALFTNLTDQAVEIPTGTVVRSLGDAPQRFRVSSPGTIPSGPGQSLALPVSSLVPGPSGNLPAGSLVAIEGQLGTSLSVTNPQPTINGTERLLPVPEDADRQELADRLKQSLQITALAEMEQDLAEGDVLIPASIHLAEVLDQDYQPAAGQPADELRLLLRVNYEAFCVAQQDINSLVEILLNSSLPEGFMPVDGSLKIENLGDPVFQGDAAEWTLRASRQVQAVLPEPQAVQLALGLDPQSAKLKLAANLDLGDAPVIRLVPSWWPRLPYIPLRIKVQVIQPEVLAQEIQ